MCLKMINKEHAVLLLKLSWVLIQFFKGSFLFLEKLNKFILFPRDLVPRKGVILESCQDLGIFT